MLTNDSSFPAYAEIGGGPLQNGKLYFGLAGQNPITSPVTVYWDANGTQPADQPVLTVNGMPSRNGAPARVWVKGDYSRLVIDSKGRQVLYEASAFPLSAGGGSDAIGFLQAGPSAVARTAGAKQRDLMSPQDKGALADGVSNDAAAITVLATSGALVVAPGGTYALTQTVDVKAVLANINSVFSSTQAVGYSVKDLADIVGGHWSSSGGVVFNLVAGSKQSIRGAVVENSSAANAHGININALGVSDVRLVGNYVDTLGYGLLTNGAATDLKGLVAVGNYFDSEQADAIEINGPAGDQKHMAIVGNVLRAGPTGTSPSAGFGIGVAAGRGIAVVGNSIKESRKEAIHFEDAQHTNAVVGNVGMQLAAQGVWIGGNAAAGGEGLPVVGNSLRAAAGSANAGIHLIWTGSGSVPGVALVGNRLAQFARGLSVGAEDAIAYGNTIESASECAVFVDGGGNVHGMNLARNCPTLAKTGHSSFIGKIASATQPSTLLDTSTHVANTAGSMLKGFAFPLAALPLAAATSTQVDLFELPLLMRGRLIVLAQAVGSGTYIYMSATLLWDGVTLTVSEFLKKTVGTVDASGGSASLNAAGGRLRVNLFNGGALVNITAKLDFEGEYYK